MQWVTQPLKITISAKYIPSNGLSLYLKCDVWRLQKSRWLLLITSQSDYSIPQYLNPLISRCQLISWTLLAWPLWLILLLTTFLLFLHNNRYYLLFNRLGNTFAVVLKLEYCLFYNYSHIGIQSSWKLQLSIWSPPSGLSSRRYA